MARPSFEPTDQQRARVAQLVSFGLTQRELCALVQGEEGKPISEKTLRKHFAEELAYGSCQANVQIAQTLYRKAMSGDTAALIFWLKTRARWTVTDKVEISGPDGQPVAIEAAKARFLAKLAGATAGARTEAAAGAAES